MEISDVLSRFLPPHRSPYLPFMSRDSAPREAAVLYLKGLLMTFLIGSPFAPAASLVCFVFPDAPAFGSRDALIHPSPSRP